MPQAELLVIRPLGVSEMRSLRFTGYSLPFGPSFIVPGLAYLFPRLSAYGVPQCPSDCMIYFALC